MAASITPDPFVPSGHYRVRSPIKFAGTLARGILQGVPSRAKGWHCASSKRGLSGAQLEIDVCRRPAIVRNRRGRFEVRLKRVPAARTGNLGRPSLSSSARWPDLARMFDDFSS